MGVDCTALGNSFEADGRPFVSPVTPPRNPASMPAPSLFRRRCILDRTAALVRVMVTMSSCPASEVRSWNVGQHSSCDRLGGLETVTRPGWKRFRPVWRRLIRRAGPLPRSWRPNLLYSPLPSFNPRSSQHPRPQPQRRPQSNWGIALRD